MSENLVAAEDPAERANLVARAPHDMTAKVLEETIQAFVRLTGDAKHIITRAAAQLAERQRAELERAEAVGAAAAAKAAKPRKPKPAPEQLCHCTLFKNGAPHPWSVHQPLDEAAP